MSTPKFAVPPGATELMKHDPESSGGMQLRRMTTEEVQHRLCCLAGCPGIGAIQVRAGLVGGSYRILCSLHAVRLAISWSILLGDPSPMLSGQTLARAFGVPDELIAVSLNRLPALPEEWVCVACGGGMSLTPAARVAGSTYAAREFYHRCVAT